MREEKDDTYRATFTAAERSALGRAAEAATLEPEAELLRVLIMRELARERCDDEQVGRLVDRLVRVVRAQKLGARAEGRDPRVDEMIGWLGEIARQKRAPAARAPDPRLALPEAGR